MMSARKIDHHDRHDRQGEAVRPKTIGHEVPAPPPAAASLSQQEPVSETRLVAAPKVKQRRGFAAMDPAKHKEIARKGGQKAHADRRAHEFTTEEARAAGKKGGALAAQARVRNRAARAAAAGGGGK